MRSELVAPIVAAVARRTGVPTEGRLTDRGILRIRPSELPRPDGFSVELRKEWRSADARFVPGRFAKPLIRRFAAAPVESRISFGALGAEAGRYGKLKIRVNGRDMKPGATDDWPDEWSEFELSLRRGRLDFGELTAAETVAELSGLVLRVYGMVIALIGVDDVEADESALEGDATERVSRGYERKPINRDVCLSLKGRRCHCCGFDFAEKYGRDADGFIEIHHRVPVAGMGPGYLVHPVRDLFPVCSNCHSVIHLSNPALDPDELRARLLRASRKP
jgi:5-methylcytosine-specific restriction protein A